MMPDSDREKVSKIETAIREWIGKQGHDQCWYYPDIFRVIATTLDIPYTEPSLPSREEFCRGCARYQQELYDVSVEGRAPAK